MAQRILALEIDGDWVRAVVAERSWNALAIAGMFEQQRAAGESGMAGALNRLVAQTGKPDIVISALPGDLVAKRLLTLPFHDRRRLQQVVPFELEEHLPFPVDDAVVAFARLGAEDGKTLVAAAYARKDDLRDHLELLARAGLDPHTVTLSSLALANLMARLRNGHQGSHVVVNLDHSCASMVLLDESGLPRALRTITTGAAGRGATQLPVAIANAILNSVRQMLLASAVESEQAQLVLLGPSAETARVKTQIAEALALPVRAAEDFDLAAAFGGAPAGATGFGSCLAMLLGELPNRPAELLNFRQGELAFHGRTGDLSPFRLSAILAAAIVVLAIVYFALGLSSNLHRLHILNNEIAAAAEPALGPGSGANARERLRSGIADMRKELRLLGGGANNAAPLDSLLAISRGLPAGLPVQMTDVAIDGAGVKLSGEADSFATIDQVKAALARGGQFDDVQVTDAKAAAQSGKVDFRLSAALADSSARGR